MLFVCNFMQLQVFTFIDMRTVRIESKICKKVLRKIIIFIYSIPITILIKIFNSKKLLQSFKNR